MGNQTRGEMAADFALWFSTTYFLLMSIFAVCLAIYHFHFWPNELKKHLDRKKQQPTEDQRLQNLAQKTVRLNVNPPNQKIRSKGDYGIDKTQADDDDGEDVELMTPRAGSPPGRALSNTQSLEYVDVTPGLTYVPSTTPRSDRARSRPAFSDRVHTELPRSPTATARENEPSERSDDDMFWTGQPAKVSPKPDEHLLSAIAFSDRDYFRITDQKMTDHWRSDPRCSDPLVSAKEQSEQRTFLPLGSLEKVDEKTNTRLVKEEKKKGKEKDKDKEKTTPIKEKKPKEDKKLTALLKMGKAAMKGSKKKPN